MGKKEHVFPNVEFQIIYAHNPLQEVELHQFPYILQVCVDFNGSLPNNKI